MRTTAACFLLALIGTPALAEDTRLDLDAFFDLMDGRTGHFSLDGEYYGSEAYHPDHRVIWRDTDGQCQEGTWRNIADFMCFQYDNVSCWQVFATPEGEHYAVEDSGLRVEFDRITDGAFDCNGAPLS